MSQVLKRGDIVEVDLRGAEGGEKMGTRPCVVVQNDTGNRFSPLTIVVPLTDARQQKSLPVQVAVNSRDLPFPLSKDSVIECGHIRVIDKSRIGRTLGSLPPAILKQVDAALKISLGLGE